MGSPLERRERAKAELRTKILDAARELFISEGYDAVTMRKVAEKVEYSPTAIYLHFADKDALIRDLCLHDFAAFAGRFAEAAAIADPIERLQRAGDVYVAFGLTHPQQYRLMFMTPHPPIEPTAQQSADPAQNAYLFLRTTIAQAIEQGLLRPEHSNADLVAQTVWAAMHGVVSLEIAKGCESGWIEWSPVAKRAGAMVDVIFAAFLKEPTGRPRPRGSKKGRR
jgi:AcrR family transcriptional regulator